MQISRQIQKYKKPLISNLPHEIRTRFLVYVPFGKFFLLFFLSFLYSSVKMHYFCSKICSKKEVSAFVDDSFGLLTYYRFIYFFFLSLYSIVFEGYKTSQLYASDVKSSLGAYAVRTP